MPLAPLSAFALSGLAFGGFGLAGLGFAGFPGRSGFAPWADPPPRAAASPRREPVTRSRPVGTADERRPGTPTVSSPATRNAPGPTP